MAVALERLIDEQSEEELCRYSLRRLFEEVRVLMTQRHAIDYRLLLVLRELDQRAHLDGRPIHLARWLHDIFGIGYGAAREKIRTARTLGHLPETNAAFREGRLSYSKVRALTRMATAETEAALLPVACRTSTEQLELMAKRYKQCERLDDVQAMLRQRSLNHYWAEDGMLVVHARLSPEQGAIWVKAMEKAERDIQAIEVNEHRAEEDQDSYRARHADAVTQVLEDGLSGCEGTIGDRYQVTVHVSAETLCESERGSGASAADGNRAEAPTVENGPHLHPETVKRLSCDGALVSVLENGAGEVLNVGRKTRVIHPSIRRALKARDGHCQYPGCSQSRYVDGHHLVHWADGGETKLKNLVLLCRRHHRLVHEFGYVVQNTAAGFEFVHRGAPARDVSF